MIYIYTYYKLGSHRGGWVGAYVRELDMTHGVARVEPLYDAHRAAGNLWPAAAEPANVMTLLTDELRPVGGFILAENLALAGTAGDNGSADKTSNMVSGRMKLSLGGISSGNVCQDILK